MGWGLHTLRVPRAGAATGAGKPQALQFVRAGGRGTARGCDSVWDLCSSRKGRGVPRGGQVSSLAQGGLR